MRLGGTVRELLARMDAREYLMWQVHDEYSPIGDERGDLQAGLIASTVANQWRGEKDKAVATADMMPDFGGARKRREAKERARAKIEKWKRYARLAKEAANGRHRTRDAEGDG